MKQITKNIGALFLAALMLSLTLFGSFAAYAADGKDPYDYLYGKNYDISKGSGLYIGEGNMVCGGNTGKYIGFKDVNFDRKPYEVVVWLATGQFGQAELRLDSAEGKAIATLTPVIGAWNESAEIAVGLTDEIRGKHDVYFVWTAGPCNFDKMIFNTRETVSAVSEYAEYNEAASYADIAGHTYENDIETTLALGLQSHPTGDSFKPEKPVTRGEFAKVLSNIINQDGGSGVEFEDLEITDENYSAICAVVNNGILKGISETEFGVNSFLTVTDALVASLRILGYEQKAIAKGGYPGGYLSVAAGLKLTNGLDTQDTLRNGNLARVVVNLINADYMSETGYLFDLTTPNGGSLKKVGYEAVAGILSKTKGIYKNTGVVEANSVTSIYSHDGGTDGNAVIIDDVRYSAGVTAACSLIGMLCDYYYTEDNTLVAIVPNRRFEQVVIHHDQTITELSQYQISYYETEESTRLRNLKCDAATLFIYNGKAADTEISKIMTNLDAFSGQVRWLDNDADGTAEVVMIDEYENLVISGVSEEHISGTLGSATITRRFGDAVVVFRKDGEETSIDKIAAGSVCMLYVSQNSTGEKYVRVDTYTKSVEGQVTMADLENGAVIDGVTYQTLIDLTAGSVGTFYLNGNDEIVRFSTSVGNGKQVGLFLECDKKKSSKRTLQVKIATREGVKLYPCASKVWVDGVRCETYDEAAAHFIDSDTRVPILYKLNNDGEISMMDTLKDGNGGENDVLRYIGAQSSVYYREQQHGFTYNGYLMHPVADDAVLMTFGNTEDDSSCTVADFYETIRNLQCINARFYTTRDGDSKVANIIVWPNKFNNSVDGNQWDYKTVMVKNTFTAVDAEGNETMGIAGYEGKLSVKLTMNASAFESNVKTSSDSTSLADTVRSLKKGDLIQYQKNGSDEVIGVKLLYSGGAQKNSAGISTALYQAGTNNKAWDGGDNLYNINMLGTIGKMDDSFYRIELVNGSYEYLQIDVTAPVLEYDCLTGEISRESGASSLAEGDLVVINMNEALVSQVFKFTNMPS